MAHIRLIDESDAEGALKEEYDAAVSDAIQVIGYFNYVTRVADPIGIEDEPDW